MNEIPNRPDLYQGVVSETDEGMAIDYPIGRLVRESKRFSDMGAGEVCPRCGEKQAMFFGDPDGDHWCIVCQLRADAEKIIADGEALP